MIAALTNHLWQSTLFAIAAGLLALAFRRNRAQVRYWIWFSASLKFLIPLSLLLSLGSSIHLARQMPSPTLTLAMGQITQPFSDNAPFVPSTPSFNWMPVALIAFWLIGFAAIAVIRFRSWREVQAAVRASKPVDIPVPVEVRMSPGLLEPGVVGIFHSILLLPEGIIERLTPSQLGAVMGHELSHIRRRDNLFASIHMIVEAAFWFHPLVWWIGARMVEERERACDEEVLLLTGEPAEYAEGILNVCTLYLESPLACVSGITGSNLRRRIESIIANRIGQTLTLANKILLVSAGLAALGIPLVVGLANAAQSPAPAGARFDVASIRPNNSGDSRSQVRLAPGGKAWATNATLKALITTAYSLPDLKLSGGPAWMDSARFDMDARGQGKNPDEVLAMLQTLLAERFQLKVHRETKELPIYALLVAKNGPKLDPPRGAGCFDPLSVAPGSPPPEPNPGEGPVRPCGGFNMPFPGQMYGAKVPMWRFTMNLTRILGRNVVNKTGLDGPYDITLRWHPVDTQSADDSLPSIFTAVQEQLGLRLESQKGPVEVLVVDRAERPSEN